VIWNAGSLAWIQRVSYMKMTVQYSSERRHITIDLPNHSVITKINAINICAKIEEGSNSRCRAGGSNGRCLLAAVKSGEN
jgi:hypothetical protein